MPIQWIFTVFFLYITFFSLYANTSSRSLFEFQDSGSAVRVLLEERRRLEWIHDGRRSFQEKPYSPFSISVSSISTRYPKIIKMNEKNRIKPVFLLLFTQLLAQSILQVRFWLIWGRCWFGTASYLSLLYRSSGGCEPGGKTSPSTALMLAILISVE